MEAVSDIMSADDFCQDGACQVSQALGQMLRRACTHRMQRLPGALRTFSKMAQRVVDPWFKVLGVPQTATLEETRKAFLLQAMQNHQDRNHGPDAHERMIAVIDAWKSAQADISARVDQMSATAAARQQQQPSAERAAADQRSEAERNEAWRKAAAAERVAAGPKTARHKKAEQAERRAAERRAEDEFKARRKEAELRLKAAAKAKARNATKRKAFLEAKRKKEAADRDAKQKEAADAAEAAQLARLEMEAVLIASASDDVLVKAAAKRGWLAYYAHVSVVRSMRAIALSWEPLSAQRTTNLIVIEALADAADSEVIGLAVGFVPRYAKSRAIVGIRDGIIIPAASGLDRIGVLGAIVRFFGVARLFYHDLTNPPSKPRGARARDREKAVKY